MNANPATPSPAVVAPVFTLNDLRMQSSIKEPSSNSGLKLTGAVLAVVLAISAFIWADPLSLFTTTGASPSAFGSSADPARATERPENIAPPTIAAATTAAGVLLAPAVVVGAPGVSVEV